jgi:hypothetical protein
MNHYHRIKSEYLCDHQEFDDIQSAFATLVLRDERLGSAQFVGYPLL